ncbi:MAG: GlsB/YeaQ/YmgE family stress response membrane protein [Actinomycetota bacterium]|nr:GlsB/YeaQ/YmgE family stress response membrane protein [Actinomycetota bacterium]
MIITGVVIAIIVAIVIGLVVGALARLVLPGKQDIPIWLTILLGIVGAVVGTVIAQFLGVAVTPGIDWIEIALQVAVAAVGIALVAPAYGRRRMNR